MKKEDKTPEIIEFEQVLREKKVSLYNFMDLYAEFSDLDFNTKEILLRWYYNKIKKEP